MRRTFAWMAALVLTPAPVPPVTAWSPPTDGPVVRSFEAPAGRYGPGHRGVDYAAAPGSPVRAAGPGTVVFAAGVGGGLHVVVAHAAGLRTGYSFLSRLTVKRGDSVAGGAVVGLSGGTGPTHAPGVLHFSLRDGSGYTDPMQLFGAAPVVRLAPLDGPGPVVCKPERRPGPAATLTGDPARGRESSRPQSRR